MVFGSVPGGGTHANEEAAAAAMTIKGLADHILLRRRILVTCLLIALSRGWPCCLGERYIKHFQRYIILCSLALSSCDPCTGSP